MQRSTQLSTPQRIALFVFSLLVAVALSSIPLHAADASEYTIRSSVKEVRLAFTASDRQDHIIKSLRPTDLAVVDNGSIIRHFRSFGPASVSPLELVILLDASDSVASQIPEEIVEVRNFVENSPWGDQDRVSILAFGGLQPILICARNCTTRLSQIKLGSLHASGATPLYDALIQAAAMLKKNRNPEARAAMILFSDGIDTISIHGVSNVLETAQDLQSAIYSVNSRSRKSASGQGDAVLDYLAASTGGLSFAPGQNVERVLRTVLEDLRSGYVLTYQLPLQTAGQHSVRILPATDPKLQFRARRAYKDPGDE